MMRELLSLEPGAVSTFYATIVALLATVFALLFSFCLFAVQHAASNYSPVLLDDFKRDKRTKHLFILFITAVALNLLPVAWPPRNLLSVVAALVLAVLMILDLGTYYVYTVDLINPMRLAERLAARACASLKKVFAVPRDQPGTVTPDIAGVWRDVEALFDLVYRAVDKRELQTTRHGLAAICNITDEYFKASKDLLRRNDPFLLDLNGVCERLLALATVATKGEDVGALTQIVSAYRSVAASSLQVPLPTSPVALTHELACQAIGCLRDVSQRALGAQLADVGMAAARALGDTAGELAKRGYKISALILCDNLRDVGITAVNTGCWQAAMYCNSALGSVLASFLDTDQEVSHTFTSALEHMKTLCLYAICKERQQPSSIIGPFVSLLSPTSPSGLAGIAAARLAQAADDGQRAWRFGQLRDSIKALTRVSEEIGRALACAGMNVEVDYLRSSLERIGELCLDVRLEAADGCPSRTLERQLADVEMAFYRIWEAFPTGNPTLGHDILQSVARLAIGASEKGMDGDAQLGIRILCGIAKHNTQPGRKVSSWDPPRQAVYAAAIGIHGLNSGKEALVTSSFAGLKDFLIVYSKAWPDEIHRLEQELRELRTEWSEFRSAWSVDPWGTFFFPKITGQDIDAYTERLIGFLRGESAPQPNDSA